MDDLLKVGIITSTHGIKGEVKVFPTTDDMRRFKKLKAVFLDTTKELITLNIESVKFFKQFVILKFEGIDSINDVEKYKSRELFVDRKNAVRLSKNEFFIADLIGLNVISDDGKYRGSVTDVLSGSANDVYVIEIDGKEVMLPAIKECILNVDMDEKLITFHMMDGLMD